MPNSPHGQTPNLIAAREVLAAAKLAFAEVEAWPIAGWSLVSLPDGARTASNVEQALDAAISIPEISFATPVFFGDDGGIVFATPTLLVGFHETVAPEVAESLLSVFAPPADVERQPTSVSATYQIHTKSRDGRDVLAQANALAALDLVSYAEPDMVFTGRADLIPNDTYFADLWGLHNTGQSGGVVDADMDAPEAWDTTIGDASIVVVVIDAGVQQDHPDIHQRAGTDLTGEGGGGGPVNACDSHGTAVAGCVSATINNAAGVVGVAPGSRVGSARTFISTVPCDGTWSTLSSWTINALTWAQSIGARVTNNSNSYGFQSGAIAQKYLDTYNVGIVHFASAGNSATGSLSYPASLPAINSVAALNRYGNRASFSNWGTGLDFSAPGQSIRTTDQTGAAGYDATSYAWVNGTSFASPYAAGVAALVLSVAPQLDPPAVEQILQTTCLDRGTAGYDTGYGWGFVNAAAAVAAAQPITPGDLNCDGTYGYLSFGDINPFVLYLSDFSAWQAAYPNCPPQNGDINADGTYGHLSFGDINPFVALLSGG